MKLPISWLKDFVDIDGLSIEEIARLLTLAGLEVGEIAYVGLPMPKYNEGEQREFKTRGISWDPDKIVVAEIREVLPHPNADRLTLLDLFDGSQQHTVLTGAPNIFQLKGQGRLPKLLKVAYAKEGATLYDGHAEGLQLTTLKRAKIRGVDSYSMVCSEKELGIAEDHECIILLALDAPVGKPLADYMGEPSWRLSKLAKPIKLFPQVLINVEIGKRQDIRSFPAIEGAVQVAEKTLAGKGRVLVRPSGTEPKIRVMLEGESMKTITRLGRNIAKVIKEKMA